VKEKKTHNFALALPEHLAEQADEMLESRYNLEFLGIAQAVKERELEDRLITHLQRFILELGYGFCFRPKTQDPKDPRPQRPSRR
jgi:predicted nuclease of restriction endonuclease-like (RecB) superfamily